MAQPPQSDRGRPLAFLVSASLLLASCHGEAATVGPRLEPDETSKWMFARGDWRMEGGVLEQRRTSRASVAILTEPRFSDADITFEFRVAPEGRGVRAAAVCFRATGTMSYYWLHLDTKNNGVILVRSTPMKTWIELARRRHRLDDDVWNRVCVTCRGPRFEVAVNDDVVLSAQDATLEAGSVGFGTSRARPAARLSFDMNTMSGSTDRSTSGQDTRVLSVTR